MAVCSLCAQATQRRLREHPPCAEPALTQRVSSEHNAFAYARLALNLARGWNHRWIQGYGASVGAVAGLHGVSGAAS